MGQVSSQNRQVLLTTKVQVFLKYPVYVPCFAHTTAELHRTATCSSAIIRPPWISSQQHTSTLNSLWPHHPMPGESGLYCLYVYTHWTCPTYPLLGQLKSSNFVTENPKKLMCLDLTPLAIWVGEDWEPRSASSFSKVVSVESCRSGIWYAWLCIWRLLAKCRFQHLLSISKHWVRALLSKYWGKSSNDWVCSMHAIIIPRGFPLVNFLRLHKAQMKLPTTRGKSPHEVCCLSMSQSPTGWLMKKENYIQVSGGSKS